MAARRDGQPKAAPLNWTAIIELAAEIVRDSVYPMTIRDVHYALVARLVQHGQYRNDKHVYNNLTTAAANARREGWFPRVAEAGRQIGRPWGHDSAQAALNSMLLAYRRRLDAGQDYQVFLGVEKAGSLPMFEYVAEPRGWATFSTQGYGSETQEFALAEMVEGLRAQGRKSVLVACTDYDASGADILRNLLAHTGDIWDQVVHVGLTADQVLDLNLAVDPGKEGDPRAGGFALNNGGNYQVELNAVPREVMEGWLIAAGEPYLNRAVLAEVLAAEVADKVRIQAFLDGWA